MPVARSASASQLSREIPVSAGTTPTNDAPGPPMLHLKAHTLDRFSKPGLVNGRNETTRRKRSFMSFRLNKKGPKRKEGDGVISESRCPNNNNGNSNSGDSQDGSDSSSAASVKPKRRHLNRVGSFVRKVASRVQVAGPVLASVIPPPPPRPKTAPSLVQAEEKVPNSSASQNSSTGELINSVAEPPPPLVRDYIPFDEKQIPAVIGLRNHGNTCFINAIVQCLNHTDVLAEYFVLDAYKLDLRRCNRIGNRKMNNGSRRGEMTEQVAGVLKSLWSLRYVPDVSLALKACVDRHEAAYRGSSQHDAAEFLMFLLGKVHDDLNTASKRKYKKIKSSHGRPDEVVASETLNNHLRCNSSFVQDIFQAQFRSSLRCPRCQCESNTFDPFMCVSLPIPHVELVPIFVTVVYLNQQPKQVCLGVSVMCGSSFGELRRTLAQDCGLELASLIIVEVDGSGFHRTFADDCSVDSIGSGGSVHAIELPVDAEPAEDQGPFVLVTWLNVVSADHCYVRFGGVYQSQVARDISYRDLQKLLLKEMTTMVTTQTLTSQQEDGVFQVRVCEGSEEGVSIASSIELPLYSQSVDQALALCCPHQPQHLKLLLLWQPDTKQKYIVDDVDHVERHSSVEELKRSPPQPPPTTLADCLRLHSSAEQLSSGDAWHCPSCDRKEQGVKRLMLWSAPQILVLHLKRFRQNSLNSNSSSKLNTFVSFPLTDVDISEYVAQRSSYTTCSTANNKQNASKNSPENCKKKSSAGNADDNKEKTITTVSSVGSGVWSPWRKPKRLYQQQQLEDKHVYDLYAVCNHHGKDLQGGHYTAVCHNPSSGEWYEFDDSRVKQIPDDKVVTQDAYLLFYQRRQSNDGPCATTALNKEHWSYRIPRDCLPASLNPPIAKQATASETVAKPTPCTTSTTASPSTETMATSTAPTDAPPAPTSPLPSDPAAATPTPTPPSAALPAWKPFERGRSYGTLPGHGRSVLQSQDSTERENSSDTEAPLAIQDSPIKKRISDVQERRESEEEDTEDGSPMDTSAPHSPVINQINGFSSNSESAHKTDSVGSQSLLKRISLPEPTSDGKRNSVVNSDNSQGKMSECNLPAQTSSSSSPPPGSKTVYISRNQAIEQSKSQQLKCSCQTKEEEPCCCKETSSDDAKKPPAPKNLTTGTSSASSSPAVASRATPDVLIQPASPAVLAAHKKSVITVTLRQRSPSTSSQPISRSPSTCSTTSRASRASLISRTSMGSHKLSNASSVSSFSPETLASIITVNGVSLADNEELSAEFANSLAVSAAASNAAAASDECCRYDGSKACTCGDSKSNKSVNGDFSAGAAAHLPVRSSHVNKTASYVHVNCPAPSTSPRCGAGRSSRTPFNRSPNGSGRTKLPPTVATTNGCSSSSVSRSLVVSTNGADSVYLSHSFKDNQCNPSIISKNSRNTARSSVESVPSSKADSFNGKLSSTNDGCRCHRSSTSSSNSRNYYSDNVGSSLALRNSCGNFTNLRNGEPGCNGGRCSCRYKDSVSCGPGRVNRHSSGSLDSSHVNIKVSSRERCGSECLGEKPTQLDKNSRNRSYIASCDVRTCTCRGDSNGINAPVTCSAAIQRSAVSLACCSAVPDDCTCGAVRLSNTAATESSV